MNLLKIILLFTLSLGNAYSDDVPPLGKEAKTEVSQHQITSHKPIFFVSGNENSKFQLSLKWQFLQDQPLYFGYTQLAFWKIFHKSSPFHEIQFSPEVFYRLDSKFLTYTSIDFGLYEHTSNGKDGSESRSYDQSYIRFRSGHKYDDGFSFNLDNKFYLIYNKDEYNNDIHHYLGYYKISLSLTEILKFALKDETLTISYTPGRDFLTFTERQYGSLNLGFHFDIESELSLPTFLIDYYSGYVESITDYKENTKSIRFGIMKKW